MLRREIKRRFACMKVNWVSVHLKCICDSIDYLSVVFEKYAMRQLSFAMLNSNNHKLYVGLLSAIAFSIVVLLALAVFDHRVRNLHQQKLNSAISLIEELQADIDDTLESLNAMDAKECSQQLLTEMRKRSFLSKHVRGIAFYQKNKLICTTGLGRLPSPKDAWDDYYVDNQGRKFRMFITTPLLGQDYPVSEVRIGNYSALVKDNTEMQTLLSQFNWTFSIRYKSASSDPITITTNLNVGRSQLFSPYYQYEACTKQNTACLEVSYPNHQLFTEYWLELFSSLVVAIATAVSTALVAKSYIAKWNSIESRLKRGLNSGCFYFVYQPIVELQQGSIVGCEVLARFKDSDGEIFPDQFIPILARLGLSWKFTEMMYDSVLRKLESSPLSSPSKERFKVNFNVFPCDIVSGRIMQLIGRPLSSTERFHITLEITEDHHLTGADVPAVLTKLKQAGFLIAIDDFGTGYSNLRQLTELKSDSLKIDRSFVMDIESASIKSALIPHIVELAKATHNYIVAEGIENKQQAKILKDMGVSYGQGYYYAKPGPLPQLIEACKQESLD